MGGLANQGPIDGKRNVYLPAGRHPRSLGRGLLRRRTVLRQADRQRPHAHRLGRTITFAIYVVGISGGSRIWALERYITPNAPGEAVMPLNAARWILEVYRTVIETLQGIAWMLLVFFIFALIAYVILREFELRQARQGEPKPGTFVLRDQRQKRKSPAYAGLMVSGAGEGRRTLLPSVSFRLCACRYAVSGRCGGSFSAQFVSWSRHFLAHVFRPRLGTQLARVVQGLPQRRRTMPRKQIDPADNSANQQNPNKGSSGTNRQYDQGQGNRGKQLNSDPKKPR